MSSEPRNIAELLKLRAQLDAQLEQFQRLVAVMFTDIAGSTRYFDEHGDLAGMAMVEDCNGALKPLVTKHEGKIVKTIGDAIMAYWEKPVEAVRCAIAMQQAIAEVNKPRGPDQQIRIRVALNLGVGLLKDNDVFGDVVNVCSRIEHETAAEKIGVSPSVVEALSEQKDILCRKIGTVSLRGKSAEMDLYEVIWREEEKAAVAREGPVKISGRQLSISSGTRIEVNEDVRRAIAATIKGEMPAPKVLAAERKRFVLVEIKGDRTTGRRFPLEGSTAVAGREGTDIPFPDAPQMSPQHTLFSVLGGGLYVEDLDSADGTYVQVIKPRTLQNGDLVILGSIGFRVEVTPADPTIKVELVRLADDGSELERYSLERGETTFGRVRGTYTFGEDAFMSGQHARIVVHGDICALHDLKSTNGTFIRIREKELLDIDDTVMLGGKRLRVETEDAPAEARVPTRMAIPPSLELRTDLPKVAVLEFKNVAGDEGTEWLSTALPETLGAELRKLKPIVVVGRERVQAAVRRLGDAATAARVGGELAARWVVSGIFQRVGEKLRINLRLLDVASGEETAAGKVDGRWEELFDLQDRVAAALVTALETRLGVPHTDHHILPETRKIEAYENFAEGMRSFFKMSKASLEQARHRFEKAASLDPLYSSAYGLLGATHALRYIHRTDPEDLNKARANLEKALVLNPETAEPYPWLCYVYSRQGQLDKAQAAGMEAIVRQPDLVLAHYFLGCVFMFRTEVEPACYEPAVACFQNAISVDPAWLTNWLCLGWIAAHTGSYDHGEQCLQQTQELRRAGGMLVEFPGSEMVLGDLYLRQGKPQKALASYQDSEKILAESDNMYRDVFLALSVCGLGDVHLREGRAKDAQAEYRRALGMVKKTPRMLSHERALIRAQAGLAAAHGALGEREQVEAPLRDAASRLANQLGQPQHFVWEAAASQLCHALAVAQVRCKNLDAALGWLEKAVATGWRDHAWLGTDPELTALRKEVRFQALLEKLRALPPLVFKAKVAGRATEPPPA